MHRGRRIERAWSALARSFLSVALIASLVPGTGAQAAPRPKEKVAKLAAKVEPLLTLEAISRDPGKWAGTPPAQVRWSEDGTKLDFQWNPERGDRAELYSLDLAAPDAKPRKVPDDEKRWLTSNPGAHNRDRTLKVWAFQGNVYLHDLRTGKTREILRSAEAATNPRFSHDQRGVLYTRGDNLYEWVLETGETRQLTDFRHGKDPEEKPKLSKQEENLEKEQMELFEIVRKQDKNEKEQKERTKRERGPFPEATYLKENEAVTGLDLTPDRKYVTFILNDRSDSSKAKIVDMPKYVTKTGFVEMEKLSAQGGGGGGRTKVGAQQQKQKLGVMNATDGKIRWVEMPIEKREFSFNLIAGNAPGGARYVEWSDDGKNAFALATASDHKDRWILLLDLAAAKAKVLDTEHDDAWITWAQGPAPYAWLPDNQTLWFRSERDAYFHLYTLPITGGKAQALTSGKWEVTSAQLSRDKTKFYLTTSETQPGERSLYSVPVAGGPRTRITTGTGVFAATLSPDETQLALSYSDPAGPSDLFLMANQPGAAMKRLTNSYTDEFKGYRWRKFELVTIPDADNNLLYARLYKPDKPDSRRPAVIYVHGAGYAQNVYETWGGMGTTPFFNYLLQAGYTVLDIDYRGSAGYGRDCRVAVYRHMGGKDIDSAVVAAKWLADKQGVDARRIGIYGGSYGGFFTLMALFKHPGVFAAGAALYPVTDWAHYNHPYTANILNLPYDDDEAYRRSSPIFHAEGLADRLLILHGFQDRNVNFQDTVRLVERLIELKKTGWSIAPMPIEDHGWQNEWSRLDSYRRIFALFEEVLKRPLPAEKAVKPGARAAGM
jgi:dipeptidyl aminopeptidase/acylaminoacyl peptidase